MTPEEIQMELVKLEDKGFIVMKTDPVTKVPVVSLTDLGKKDQNDKQISPLLTVI
jgi:DNA-binding MarR family transcriptional regulator